MTSTSRWSTLVLSITLGAIAARSPLAIAQSESDAGAGGENALVGTPPATAEEPTDDPQYFTPPPLVTTPEWESWYLALLNRRLAECPRARRRTLHISADGDDILGDGSLANPYQTVARADAILGPTNVYDTAILFRRGDVFRSQTGIIVDRADITIADYGDPALPKPLLTPFQEYDSTMWGYIFGSYALGRRETRPVKWVRDSDDPDRHYIRLSDPNKVVDTPGSWHLTETTLFVNPLPEADGSIPDFRQGDRTLEYVLETDAGIAVFEDGARVENLRLHGWGMNGGPTPTQEHGVDLRINNAERAVVVGCEVYYSSSHSIVHAASGSQGGIATFVDCDAGLTTFNEAYETIFNAYAMNGENQAIFHRCRPTHGTLPSDDYDYEHFRRGRGFFAHTNGPANPSDLIVLYDGYIPGGPRSCGDTSAISGSPAAATLEDVRTFIIHETFEGGDHTGSGLQLLINNVARVNGVYTNIRPVPDAPHLTTAPASGWAINCAIDLDLSDLDSNYFGFWNGRDGQVIEGRLWHCNIHVKTRADQQFRLDFDTPHRSGDMEFVNSVFVHTGDGIARGFVGGAFPHAQSLYAAGYTVGTLPAETITIQPSDAPGATAPPAIGSILRYGATPIPELAELGFDVFGAEGDRSTAGAVEPEAWIGLDVDGDGTIGIDDLYEWSSQPVDVNADGRVDDRDRDGLTRAIRWREQLGGH